MDIGWPTNVRHIAHVTFDQLNGFLGLPVEFELEIPRRVPSASARAFGVSAESMQCSYDAKGNSVPTILMLLQKRLYDQGGLQTEGIFRINPENSKEEHLRDQLNNGIVPYDIDVHCLAGLIKAWFRELPRGVLDSLLPEQVMQCHTEDQCLALVQRLPPTQAALMNWAINLMADVVQEEAYNKMNAHNIAVVFAPNMTQMSDPVMALMHAAQVMNVLKTLVLRTLKDREAAGKITHFLTWNEPLNGDTDGHDDVGLWCALPHGATMNGTLNEDALMNGETHNKYSAGGLQSSTKSSEIIEENGSVSCSEWTISTQSSTRGSRDEGEAGFDDRGRCADRCFMLGNVDGDGVGDDITENRSRYRHFSLADWLHYETSFVMKRQGEVQHAFDDEGPCEQKLFVLGSADANGIGEHPKKNHCDCEKESASENQGPWSDGFFTSGNANDKGIENHPVKNHHVHARYALIHKPLADWLHSEPSPTIKSPCPEKPTAHRKDGKPINKMPSGGKVALTACHDRAPRPFSKRTYHLKTKV